MTAPATPPPSPLNLSAVLTEALAKSDVLWLEVDGDEHSYPTWFAEHEGGVLVVTGDAEPVLPELPEQVRLVLRSKGDGRRLLTISAAARRVDPRSAEWPAVTAALAAERLNATDDIEARWRERGTVWSLRPYGAPQQSPVDPGTDADALVAGPVRPGRGTTAGWRPWHLGGRTRRRRQG